MEKLKFRRRAQLQDFIRKGIIHLGLSWRSVISSQLLTELGEVMARVVCLRFESSGEAGPSHKVLKEYLHIVSLSAEYPWL